MRVVAMLLVMLVGNAADTCPKAIQTGTCYNPNKTPYTGSNAYDSYPSTTPEECCAECAKDPHLCAGFTLTNSGKDTKCILLSTWDPKSLHPGNCSSAQLQSFPAITNPTAQPPPITKAPVGAKNVLFLVADDMRPSIGPYKLPYAHTPNLDKIVNDVGGIAFSRAYIQQSYCAPSRNSFMSGRRPDANHVYSFIGHFREEHTGSGDWASLPGHFRNNGYTVAGSGKLFHPNVPPHFDQPFSWSPEFPYIESGDNATNLCKEKCCGSTDSSHWCAYDLKPGTYLSDQRTNFEAIEHLKAGAAKFKQDGTPFFVGQGYHKPHLTWQFPQEFLDLIPENVPPAKVRPFPVGVPPIGWHECAECSDTGNDKYPNNSIAFIDSDGNGRTLPPAQWESEMRRAYYACIAYVDSLIGDLLTALDSLGVADSTVVSFTGDHGWSLGEHDIWCKMTNSELGTRVPLLFRVPWKTNLKAGPIITPALAELVDWYPTLAELAGVPVSATVSPQTAHLGGKSLVSVMDAPDPHTVTVLAAKPVALSQFPRCWQNNTKHDGDGPEYGTHHGGPGDERNHTNSFMSMSDCHWMRRDSLDFMGYSMRTHEYRYIEWVRWDGKALAPIWAELIGTELYDHTDPDQYTVAYMDNTENVNMAHDPGPTDPEVKALIETLSKQLRKTVEAYRVPYVP